MWIKKPVKSVSKIVRVEARSATASSVRYETCQNSKGEEEEEDSSSPAAFQGWPGF